MPLPATSLRSLLDRADAALSAGRVAAARTAFAELLELAQDRADRSTELAARSMLARVALRAGQVDVARELLDEAAPREDGAEIAAAARYRGAVARLAVHALDGETARARLLAYLGWAEDVGFPAAALDAAELLARHGDRAERSTWLRRAAQEAYDAGLHVALGGLYNDLALTLDADGEAEEALEAYQQALSWHRRHGTPRQVTAAAWAVGVVSLRLDDWFGAHQHLTEAVERAGVADDVDLLALAQADLARCHIASGDEIEARRALLSALQHGRDADLPHMSPERWGAMLALARELDVVDVLA
jgi:tetratricopeptide (TPR) repeat protein